MSVTVVATPFLLLPAFISLAQAAAVAVGITGVAATALNHSVKNSAQAEVNYKTMNEEIKNLLKESNGIVTKEVMNLLCKEFDTVFVDRDVLIKTLNEHGGENIYFEGDNISCEMEGFILDFYKPEATEEQAFPPYRMKITTKCAENEVESFINDINSEYRLNTQEENYIKIKERLEKQNLKIEEEEVFEDDTIVLTVNID